MLCYLKPLPLLLLLLLLLPHPEFAYECLQLLSALDAASLRHQILVHLVAAAAAAAYHCVITSTTRCML
jgi:hypothetical protein